MNKLIKIKLFDDIFKEEQMYSFLLDEFMISQSMIQLFLLLIDKHPGIVKI